MLFIILLYYRACQPGFFLSESSALVCVKQFLHSFQYEPFSYEIFTIFHTSMKSPKECGARWQGWLLAQLESIDTLASHLVELQFNC